MSESINGEERGSRKRKRKRGNWQRFLDWMAYKDANNKSEWLQDMKSSLSLAASIITTMTFQLATNPPGGVFQAETPAGGFDDFSTQIMRCSYEYDNKGCCPGEAVMAYVYPRSYQKFVICNTISFIASLSVCLLLVSGIPLNHRLPIWILSIGMCITITSLTLTNFYATDMVTPNPLWGEATKVFKKFAISWFVLIGIIALLLAVRFFVAVAPKWIHKLKQSMQQSESVK